MKYTNVFKKIIHLHINSQILTVKYCHRIYKYSHKSKYEFFLLVQNGHQQDDDDEHLVDFLLPCQPLHELLLLFHKPEKKNSGLKPKSARIMPSEMDVAPWC